MLLNSRQQIRIYDREDNNYSANYLCSEKEAARQFTAAVQAEHRLFTPRRHFGTENFPFLFLHNIYLPHSCFHINVNKP